MFQLDEKRFADRNKLKRLKKHKIKKFKFNEDLSTIGNLTKNSNKKRRRKKKFLKYRSNIMTF